MFGNGQKVVCVNDEFEQWVHDLYEELPVKGNVYTVRTSSFGRTDIKDTGISSMEAKITLVEVKNPIDPLYKGGDPQELGFRADRFAPLEEDSDAEEEEAEERVLVGVGVNGNDASGLSPGSGSDSFSGRGTRTR